MLKGTKVGFMEMMECRNYRIMKQQEMFERNQCTLMYFGLGVPGPVKTNPELRALYNDFIGRIAMQLEATDLHIVEEFEWHGITGDEFLGAINAPGQKVYDALAEIVAIHPMSYILEIEVINEKGENIKSSSPRRCILCDNALDDCINKRRHKTQEMTDKIAADLEIFLHKGKTTTSKSNIPKVKAKSQSSATQKLDKLHRHF